MSSSNCWFLTCKQISQETGKLVWYTDSLRIVHNLMWSTQSNWRRKWQSTPVLLPGKSHGQRSLVGYSPWVRKESDTTERLHVHSAHKLNKQGDNIQLWHTPFPMTHSSTKNTSLLASAGDRSVSSEAWKYDTPATDGENTSQVRNSFQFCVKKEKLISCLKTNTSVGIRKWVQ